MLNGHIPIQFETLLDDPLKAFDVYIKTNEEKMTLYCPKGKIVPPATKTKIVDEQLTGRLYIQKNDKVYYEDYLESILDKILIMEDIPSLKKAVIAYDSIKRSAEDLFASPKAKKIQRYKKAIFTTIDYVTKNNSALPTLFDLANFDFNLCNHNINVGLFCMGITLELVKHKPDMKIHELIAGYFLHDIGKSRIPHQILHKIGALTPIEWKFIKKHPEEGCFILKKYGALTREAEIIVSQHHERNTGKGYPHGLYSKDIHIYAKICMLADTFDALTSKRPYKTECNSFTALKVMKDEMGRDLDPSLFSMFVKLLSKQLT
ncbi:HD-GYP domain-containing protein [Candidatus Latescibacterota bacterium]